MCEAKRTVTATSTAASALPEVKSSACMPVVETSIHQLAATRSSMSSTQQSLAQHSTDGTSYTIKLPGLLRLPTEVRLLIYNYAGLAPEKYQKRSWDAVLRPERARIQIDHRWVVVRLADVPDQFGVFLLKKPRTNDVLSTFRGLQQACKQMHHEITAEIGYPVRHAIDVGKSSYHGLDQSRYKLAHIQERELRLVGCYTFRISFSESAGETWSSSNKGFGRSFGRRSAHLQLRALANGRWQASWLNPPAKERFQPCVCSAADLLRIEEEMRSTVERIVCTEGMNWRSLEDILDALYALSRLKGDGT